MEITKYLCEFFFTNFWHWLGLTIMLGVIRFGTVVIDRVIRLSAKTTRRDDVWR